VTPAQVDVLDLTDAQLIDARPTPPLATRVREFGAMVLISLGLLATAAWNVLLAWFVYRAVLMIGFG
jgi:hypothetical protein